MKYSYKTSNTCCKEIEFDIEKNVISNVKFLGGGCPGNLQALARLVEGMTVEEIKEKLSDVKCGMKGTSCAGELSKAVLKAYEKIKQTC